MPDPIDRRVSPGPVVAPVVESPAPSKPVAPAAPEPTKPVDGVDAPRAGEAGGAEAPRKALNQRLGTMGRRILKGAAILGLAAGLAVGGSIFMQMQEHKPVDLPAQIEAPVDINTNGLPQGQAPPEAKPQSTAPAEMPTAPGGMPTAPADDRGTGETGEVQGPLKPRLYSPHTIRLDDVLGR